VDLPPPPPPVLTEHIFIRRWCPACAAWRTPPLPAGLVLGRGRLGVGLASLVTVLRTQLRLPLAQIPASLAGVHGLRVSQGGLVDLRRRVQGACRPAIDALLAQARASPIRYGDETGWREGGRHGYLWQLTTDGPEAVVYLAWDRSRAGAVLERLLGERFGGTLVSDFLQRLQPLRRQAPALLGAHGPYAIRARAGPGRSEPSPHCLSGSVVKVRRIRYAGGHVPYYLN
jgi:hypothetical protein